MIKKLIVPVVMALITLPYASAAAVQTDFPMPQAPKEGGGHHRHHDRAEFKQWMEQMKKYKHDFLARELALTSEQREQFFALYDKMEDEKWKIGKEVRKMEREIERKGDAATDLELEKAADANAELPGKQNEIERRYHEEFKKILTKRQLFKMADAERKFQKSLMDQRGKNKR